MEQLLPFLISSTQGLLCALIENVSVEEFAVYNLLKKRPIKFNRSQVLPKSINDESSGSRGEKGSFKALITGAVNHKTQIVSALFHFV